MGDQKQCPFSEPPYSGGALAAERWKVQGHWFGKFFEDGSKLKIPFDIKPPLFWYPRGFGAGPYFIL